MPESARSPSWYGQSFSLRFPVGIIAVVASMLLGAGAAGGVGMATREGDLTAVDEHIDTKVAAAVDARIDAKLAATVDQLRREEAAAHAAADQVAAARYEELLRRLDRIERQLDGSARP